MSDNEDGRPLSRRELRLREMEATGAIPLLSEATEPTAIPVYATEAAAVPAQDDDDIVISPVDENGRPRTRREMRELREQALAERAARLEEAAAADAAVQDAAMQDAAVQVDTEVESSVDADGEDVVDDAADEADPESAELLLAQTQPFTPADVADAEVIESDVADTEIAESDDEDDDDSEVMEGVPVDSDTLPVSAISAAVPVAAASQGYTFPDITPLDESVSVFDDPATRAAAGSGLAASAVDNGDEADFDSFIERAVAQEGAASALSTSALILPSMPESADLSGPLGETGELFVTGSIELPRSLGETGGHAALLDSLEADPLEDIGISERPASDDGIAPVSAARAVSARAVLGPVVTEAQKEKSKLPVVLIATGGGLVVAVVALLVWGATSGMFG